MLTGCNIRIYRKGRQGREGRKTREQRMFETVGGLNGRCGLAQKESHRLPGTDSGKNH